MALNVFPNDAADELREYAEKASWHCAEVRFGTKGKADAAKIEAEQHFDSFKEKLDGILTGKSCNDLKWMLWNCAWNTANTRKGYDGDASKDKERVKEHYQNVVKGGEVSERLATNVREMGWGAAWYAANTIVGYKDDAVRDKANLEVYFSKIHGEVNLVAMNFIMDQAKILSQKPKVVAKETLINKGDIQQTMAFKFSVTEGKTNSTTHNIGFSYSIETSFSAGFFGFEESKYELSFAFSRDHTFAESTTTGVTKLYEFPLTVPAHSTYVAKGMVHETKMDVPYEPLFDFGGQQRSIKGIWKGVAVSEASYEVDKK